MQPRAYLETTIASYLTARPSRDLITAANQQMTHDWWHDERGNFDLYVSQFIIEEASAGDPEAATRRLAVLVVDLPQLDVTDAVQHLAQALLTHVPLRSPTSTARTAWSSRPLPSICTMRSAGTACTPGGTHHATNQPTELSEVWRPSYSGECCCRWQ